MSLSPLSLRVWSLRVRRRTLALIGIALCAVMSWPAPPASAAGDGLQQQARIEILHADETSALVAFQAGAYTLSALELAGHTYDRIDMPGTVDHEAPGAPVTPVLGTLLGIGAPDSLRVAVVHAEYTDQEGYTLPPAATHSRYLGEFGNMADTAPAVAYPLDEAIYGQDAFYPAQLVEAETPGQIREQAVAQVQFYPVQYNPARKTVRVYTQIVAQVTWDQPIAAAAKRTASPVYEQILQDTLLNYAALDRPRAAWSGTQGVALSTVDPAATADSSALKILVNADGFYRLTRPQLVQAGLNLDGVDPRTIKIANRGTEIAILVNGEQDGSFDPGDEIIFYGSAIADIYTSENVYWLTSGSGLGKRMATQEGTPGANPTPSDFPVLLHAERETNYWLTMPNGQGEDHWFWQGRIGPNTSGIPASRSYPIALYNLAGGKPNATIRVRLKGYTELTHRTKLYLNDTPIDDQSWQGQIIFDHEVTVAHALLQEGENVVRVETLDTGAVADQVYVNWIEVEYWDTYAAEDDQLLFHAPQAGSYTFRVSGFGDEPISVFDISEPDAPKQIVGAAVTPESGAYAVAFNAAAGSATRYAALTAPRLRSPLDLVIDVPSAWKSTAQAADYIIITHEDFYTNTLPLADHHAGNGLRVAVVKVQDVYDEFNHGIFNPSAIRSFLGYAYQNWQAPAPSFVLLVGDASQDYQDWLGSGTVNYVPSQIVEASSWGQTVSDNWFVAVAGDDILPDMMIGRLSAESAQQVDTIVGKVVGYAENPPGDDWNTKVLFVADDNSQVFATMQNQMLDRLPYYYNTSQVYVEDYPPGDPTQDIRARLDSGSVLVSYAGHGDAFSWGRWDGERKTIWSVSDTASLGNTGRLSVMTLANCLNGFFAGFSADVSLAEAFQRAAGKGTVAVFAPTSLGYPSGHSALLGGFYDAVFSGDQVRLGMAATEAKLSAYAWSKLNAELVETYVLFGDPATEFGIPANYPYVEQTTPANQAQDVPVDQEVQIVFNKSVDPASVVLTGSGAELPVFTPVWNADNTVVTFGHTGFALGASYQLTVTAQDMSGNGLGQGPVPSQWSFTVSNSVVDVYLPVALE